MTGEAIPDEARLDLAEIGVPADFRSIWGLNFGIRLFFSFVCDVTWRRRDVTFLPSSSLTVTRNKLERLSCDEPSHSIVVLQKA